MVGAAWGVFVFREFRGAPPSINRYLVTMFLAFLSGLALIIIARL
jgi:glucose uptake protein